MTKTTLKAVWFGGGGLLATWLAVTPQGNMPAAPTNAVQRQTIAAEQRADDLNAQTDRLRDRSKDVVLPRSTRNPFRFSFPKSPTPSGTAKTAEPVVTNVPPLPATPPPPALKLSGVALKEGRRTAVISGEGQLYIVGEGDSVAGRYTVVTVDPEAVLLRDADGIELRLALP